MHMEARQIVDTKVPLDFRWFHGARQPVVRPREVVIWEDISSPDDIQLKLLIRPRNQTYTLLTLEGTDYVSDSRQVLAGAGLTGGGALTSDVTLNLDLTYLFGQTFQVIRQVATPTVPSAPAFWFKDRQGDVPPKGDLVHINGMDSAGAWGWEEIMEFN